MNKFAFFGLTAVVAAVVSFGTVRIMGSDGLSDSSPKGTSPVHFTANRTGGESVYEVAEFTRAAALVTKSIVHIKVKLDRPSPDEMPYGRYNSPQQSAPVMASGSGVIWSKDGYIVTNNHVVEGATAIEVILTDKRIFSAKLIGRDPNTDLALIRINTEDLTPIQLGNSDDVQIGEWVLAAGYPFSLNTTVTAGIVSAKERSIGIIGQGDDQSDDDPGSLRATSSSAVEAYIQTDAAINPGNSGGALVNTSGQLIGINAAIASQTGSYAGYGFAIPVNLVSKVINDLREFGEVKRGILGVSFPSPATEDEFLIQQGIKPGSVNGAYLTGVQERSAAALAGLKPGDIIQSIDGAKISSSVELSERIARHHPGDALKVEYRRGSQVATVNVTLQAQPVASAVDALGPQALVVKLGASFEPLSEAFKQRSGLYSGLAVSGVTTGGLFEEIGIQRGSIVISVNGNRINTTDDLSKAFKAANNGIVRFECITPDGSRIVFNLSLGA